MVTAGREDATPAAIHCHGLRSAYPDGPEVLADVTFSIAHGERVALVGPNGAGKSTLLRAVAGVQGFSGELSIEGVARSEATQHVLRSRVGLVFQNPDDQLFAPTIAEDVAFGPRALGLSTEEVDERVRMALDAVGLRASGTRSPFHLSFGERRLAAIAGVLAMRPSILLMDEPTSNLDPRSRRALIRWINDRHDDTMLLATHDLDFALDTCSRVLLLHRRIMADGPAPHLLLDETLLRTHGLELPLGHIAWRSGA
jgi:cobalt/nickel transport system ATP-binding protein